ncbi:aldose 1-epimerase family protein [Psychromarinibacter halotolerans]|uniref:Aldose 1-epimerase family protein n=1 Tax=Psychromarinibacter halotolerans TaxID=1775175 RepID=A0ABV7GW15_9RHOB|nr:aldose 1-epimerase family protein [Psychromarinibacter halotolerans]MDF0597683.1 aldose 1-epimerase family protein [Psychromarinibacter halotolerans]
MVQLYGKHLSRGEFEALSGASGHAAGVRLVELVEGVERGMRMLEFRSGTGLRFTVLVDRAMDIAECDYRGQGIGWHSPAGFRAPTLHDYEGEGGLGWMRSFSGLMVTCGLDHILFMNETDTASYHYGPRQTASHSLHGRVGTIPARLTGYGERWEGDELILWAEGVVTQGAVFAEHLELHRRIEITVGTNDIRLSDRVVNRGFYRTPHMFCYHINVGHPLLDEGARYVAPIHDVVWAAHADSYDAQGVGYRDMPGPQMNFHEQVWQHDMAADAEGRVPVALVNDRLGLGFMVTTRKDQFPCQYEWQNLQAGQYAIGIEPSSHHVLGNQAARDRGEMIWLEHGDARSYDTVFSILPDADAVAEAEARIRAISDQPDQAYPATSGHFRALEGRE